MKKCKYSEDYLKNFQALTDFVDVMENAEKTFKQLYDRVGELERETSDLLHDFEFDKFYRTEGHRKARRLQAVRQERRAAKNTMELLYPLKEFARNNRQLRGNVKRIIKEIERVAAEQEARVYKPRVLEDMAINDKHFESNVIELNN